MNRYFQLFLITGVITLLGVSQVKAQTTLFYDDFESDTAGTYPTSYDLDPVIGAGDIGGSWVVIEGIDYGVQVLNDDPPNPLRFG